MHVLMRHHAIVLFSHWGHPAIWGIWRNHFRKILIRSYLMSEYNIWQTHSNAIGETSWCPEKIHLSLQESNSIQYNLTM